MKHSLEAVILHLFFGKPRVRGFETLRQMGYFDWARLDQEQLRTGSKFSLYDN